MSDDPHKTIALLREALRINAVETNKVRAQNDALQNDLRRTRLELADARKEIARLSGHERQG